MGAIAALAAGLLAAAGGVDPETVAKVETLLRAGDAAEAAKILDPKPLRDQLAADPGALDAVCGAAAFGADALAEASPGEARRVTDLLEPLAEAALEARPESLLARRSRAFASLASARLRALLEPPAAPGPFLWAAEDLAAVYGKDPRNGRDLVTSAEALAEAAVLPGADAAALWGRVEAAASAVRDRHADAPAVLADAALLLVDRARWGAAKGEKGVDARLEAVLAFLAPALKASPEDIDLSTTHNEAVSLALRLGLKRPRAAFRTRPLEFPHGLSMEIPVSRFWIGPAPGGTTVYQRTRRLRGLRTLVVDEYPWNAVCQFGEITSVKGDSIKDVAEKVYEISCRTLARVKTRRPTARCTLRQCDPGWFFELEGTNLRGEYSRRRGWHFKSKEGWLTTYEVMVFDYREGERDDPALDSVLDSIREREK